MSLRQKLNDDGIPRLSPAFIIHCWGDVTALFETTCARVLSGGIAPNGRFDKPPGLLIRGVRFV
jgi:hypothetical protein